MPRTALGAALHRIDAWLDSKITGLDPGFSALGPDFSRSINTGDFLYLVNFIDQIKDIIQNRKNKTVGPVGSSLRDVMDTRYEIQDEITRLLFKWFQQGRFFNRSDSLEIPLHEVWFYIPDAGMSVSTVPDASPNIKINIASERRDGDLHTYFSLVFTFN